VISLKVRICYQFWRSSGKSVQSSTLSYFASARLRKNHIIVQKLDHCHRDASKRGPTPLACFHLCAILVVRGELLASPSSSQLYDFHTIPSTSTGLTCPRGEACSHKQVSPPPTSKQPGVIGPLSMRRLDIPSVWGWQRPEENLARGSSESKRAVPKYYREKCSVVARYFFSCSPGARSLQSPSILF